MMSENKVGTYRFVAAFMLQTGVSELLRSMRIIIHGYFPV